MNSSYSWVIPVRNEAKSLPSLIKEIMEVMADRDYEIVVVDDNSTDDTLAVVNQLPVIGFQFRDHVGKWEALRLGLRKAKKDIIITIDGDLQDNPGEVLKLITKLSEGFDAVTGMRVNRKLVSIIGSRVLGFQDVNTPYKVFKRRLVRYLPSVGSQFRFLLWTWRRRGFKITEIPIVQRKRRYGKSHFSWLKYIKIISDLVCIWIKKSQ